MIKINLLAEAKRPAAVRRAKTPAGRKMRGEELSQWLLLGALLLALAACGLYWWMLSSQGKAKEREIVRAQEELRRLEPIIREVEEYKSKKAELENKIAVISELKANQRGPVRIMDAISRALPELLWLNRLEMTRNTVRIQGRAFNTNAVASLLENLDRVPEFREPELLETKREGQVYSFSLQFAYQPSLPQVEAAANGGSPPAEPPAAGSATGC